MISVIVPIYNAEKYVTKCIESIIAAKQQNKLEILLINDGSTDNSLAICQQFSENHSFIVVLTQENSGPSVARNRGIKVATGDYLVFVDADDYVEPTYLSDLYTEFVTSKSDLVCCGYFDHSKYGKVATTNYNEEIIYEEVKEFIPFILDKVGGVLWDKMFKKDIIIKNNITFNTNILLSEDLLFVLEYLKYTNKTSIISKHLYHYNRTQQSGLSREYDLKKFEYILQVNQLVSNYLSYFDFKSGFISEYLNKRKIAFTINFSRSIALNNSTVLDKRDVLKEFRSFDGYDLSLKNISLKWLEYPVIFFLNYRMYYWLLFYCDFLFSLERFKKLLKFSSISQT